MHQRDHRGGFANIEPFHAIEINQLAYELMSQGRSVIHMQFGQPSTGAPRAAIAAAHAVLDREAMGYWESPALLARLSRFYQEAYGVKVEASRFILTCGASPAMVLALSSSFSRDARIAMARPGYGAYRNTVKALHLQPVEIDCGAASHFRLTAASVAALDPAPDGLIIASPANPTGAVISSGELEAIARVCQERRIQIISDEIYHGITYVKPASCILEFDPGAIVVNSFSKYFSMVGWRLGWLLLPPERVERARLFQQSVSDRSFAESACGSGRIRVRRGVGGPRRGLYTESRTSAGCVATAWFAEHRAAGWCILHLCRCRTPDR